MVVTLIARDGLVSTVEIPEALRHLEVYGHGVVVANDQPIVRAGLTLDEAVRLALLASPRSQEVRRG